MNKIIKVGDRTISEDSPLFIISEVGNQCSKVGSDGHAHYDLETAYKLVDATADAGADAIKFFFWYPDEIISDKDTPYSYKRWNGKEYESFTENMYEMLDRFRFSEKEWAELQSYCSRKKVIFFSTIISPGGINLANYLIMELYKVSSWDYNYTALYRWVAQTLKPTIIDTGPVNTYEVARTMQIFREEGNLDTLIMYCFHTNEYSQMNMNSIPYCRQAFDPLVGYSSADYNDETDIMAVTLGACALEKRITIDRKNAVLHSAQSKEPEEFKRYVELMRNVQKAKGKYDLIPSKNDMIERRKWFRHLVADRNIQAGETITWAHIEAKRGEYAVSPEFEPIIVGRTAKRDIKRNEPITWEDV